MTIRIVTASGVCAILAVLPVFLTGAMATFIRDELRFSEARLGVAVSVFYVASTLTSATAGDISERIGARRTLGLAAALSSVSLLGIGLMSRTWWHLTAFLALGGAASAFAQPATNLALTRLIRPNRLGLAFGLKQASGPAATLVAGAAVPLIGISVGWRWAFALSVLLAVIYAITMPDRGALVARVNPRREAHHASTGYLLMLSAAVSLAVATAGSLGAFFVESAVAHGWSPSVAGAWLAVGSLGSILARIGLGWHADRIGPRLEVVAALMLVGSVGVLLLGHATSLAVLATGSIVSFAAGWGWPGLFQFVAVRLRENADGQATGIVMIGMYIGGVYGPSSFGLLVEHGSYRLAWNVAAGAMATTAVLLLVGRRIIDRKAASR